MSNLSKYSEHLKLNHYNYMTWRNPIHVDLPAYEIAIDDKHYPIGTGNAAAIRAQEQDSKTRQKELPQRARRQCRVQISYIDNLNGSCEALKAKYDARPARPPESRL